MPKRSFPQKLEYYQTKFEPYFASFLNGYIENVEVPKGSKLSRTAIELINELSLRGGKRQRVAFLFEGYKLFNKGEPKSLLDCAVSIELLQTHLLIHDDLVDNSSTRRGGPTTFRQVQKLGLSKASRELGMTLMVGDIAAYMAIEAIMKSKFLNDSLKSQVSDIQITAGINTFMGQIFDLERDLNRDFKEDDIRILADFKAARSSTIAPLLIAAAIAGKKSSAVLKRLATYGYLIGVAMQLQDDYLGVFGNEETMGKSATSDITEGKRTLLVIHAQKHSSKAGAAFIEKIIQNGTESKADIDMVKNIMSETGSDVYVKDMARTYAFAAAAEVEGWSNWDKDARDFFSEAADWGVKRAA